MNGKPTRMLFAAVALSAFAAVLASSAQARIPEGNGTQPPSRTVVKEQQTAQGSGAFFVDPQIYSALASATVAYQQQTRQASVAFVDPEIYAAMTSSAVVEQRLARHRSGTFFTDGGICTALDRAIRVAIPGCSHAVPLTAEQLRPGNGQRLFPAGYRGLP